MNTDTEPDSANRAGQVSYEAERLLHLDAAQLKRIKALRVIPFGEHGRVTTLAVSGKCPVCRHETQQVAGGGLMGQNVSPPGAIVGILPTRPPTGVVGRDALVVVTCQCAEVHKKAPAQPTAPPSAALALDMLLPPVPEPKASVKAGEKEVDAKAEAPIFGCGRSWMIRVHYDLAKPVVDGDDLDNVANFLPVQDLHERDTSYWSTVLANQAGAADAPAKARESAGKWQPVLTAIITLVGISTIVAGRDSLAKMSSFDAWVIVIGLIVTLVCAAIGAWNAQSAATGPIGVEEGDTRAGIGAYRASSAHEAFKLRRRLRVAAVFTAVAFALGLLVLGFWLRTPNAPSTPVSPKVAITFDDGESFSCASLLPTDDAAMITFQPAGEAKTTRDATTVSEIKALTC